MKGLESIKQGQSRMEKINTEGKMMPVVTIFYCIMHRYDLIIMDSFSFQHSFVCFLHYFLLSLRIAAFYAIYRYLTLFYCRDSLELQGH